MGRWDRGVDLTRFDPGRRVEGMFGGEINVLYAGRLTSEKGIDLLADAFEAARRQDPRLHLVLAGPSADELAAALLAIVWTPLLAQRLRKGAQAAVRDRGWEDSLAQLAAGYRTALLRAGGSGRGVRVA